MSAKRMAAKRSFVGTISWITAHHVDFSCSDTQALCKLIHTRGHGMDGYFWVIRMSEVALSTMPIACSTLYSRCLNVFGHAVFPDVFMYAISIA